MRFVQYLSLSGLSDPQLDAVLDDPMVGWGINILLDKAFLKIPPPKTNMTLENQQFFKRRYIFKWLFFFNCPVSFPGV